MIGSTESGIPQGPRPENIQVNVRGKKESSPLEINSRNVEKLDLKSRATLERISNFIINNKENLTGELDANLIIIRKRLEKQIKKSVRSTTGFVAFFKHLFNRSAKLEKNEQINHMKALVAFIDAVRENSPKSATPKSAQAKAPTSASEGKEEVSGSEAPPREAALPAAPPPPSGFAPPPPPLPAAKPGVGGPPPPPPPPGFGPPPPPGAPGRTGSAPQLAPKLSPEEQHIQREKKKLANKLQERANPTKFYITTPPKDERNLQKRQQELIKDIEEFSSLLPEIKDAAKKQRTESSISKKKEELANVEEELKGTSAPVRSNQPEFKEKIKNYTNEELKILIALAFDGKKPEEGHFNFGNYQNNSALLDNVFKDWNQISKGESGKAFLAHKEEWQRYLSSNLFGVIDTLKKRVSEKKSEHLEEPVYEIPPYKPAKTGEGLKKATSEPVIKKPQPEGDMFADIRKGAGGLKKAQPSTTPLQKKEEPLTVLDEIRQRKPLRKVEDKDNKIS